MPLDAARLPAPRLAPPSGPLAEICDASAAERAGHAYGKSYLDTIRAFRGVYDHAPDFVARPRDERDIEELLAWAAGANAAVIPYGGGTSVVGGVEARVPERFDGAVCLDLGALDSLLELDETSRAACIGAGAAGPTVEELLGAHGLTMRFFPQSVRALDARRLGRHARGRPFRDAPDARRRHRRERAGDHAGGQLGVAPAARLGRRPEPRPDAARLGGHARRHHERLGARAAAPGAPRLARRALRPASCAGAEAVRALAQSGLDPSNCRLIDELEAQQTGAGDGSHARARAGLRVDGLPRRRGHAPGARDLPRARRRVGRGGRPAAAHRPGARRSCGCPTCATCWCGSGVLADTFETAITWDRFEQFHASVTEATREALGEPCRVTCRFTHVYPDGPAPYFTVIAPARRGDEVAQWHEMKHAAGDAIIAGGGTITHHHAVGRDHRPWYDAQRPELFAAALRGAKAAVDPAGLMNPGVLI